MVKKKKGAVELSLNLIIMLIIGLVVLGLVIGFVKQLVSKSTSSFVREMDEHDQQMLDQVKSSPENLAVLPSTTIRVKKGGEAKVFIKVRNYGSSSITIDPGDLPSSGSELTAEFEDGSGSASSDLKLQGPGFDIEPGKEESHMYILKAEDTASSGKYYYLILTLEPSTGEKTTVRRTIYVE